jgi:tetratricopeptide (TPR) repeat protein
LGVDHPLTLEAMNNLTFFQKDQGYFDEAKSLYEECMEKQLSTMGPGHPDVPKSLNNLADIVRVQGRFDDAERFIDRALQQVHVGEVN